MPEQAVIVRMDVEGNATDRVRALGSEAKSASRAIDDAERELRRLFQSGQGSSADFQRLIGASRGGGTATRPTAESDVPRATLEAEYRGRVRTASAFARDERAYAREQQRQRRDLELARSFRVDQGDGGGGRDSLNPLAGTPFQRLGSTIFLIHALGVSLDQLAKGAERFVLETQAGRNAFNAYVDAIATGTRQAAESIPIVGGFTRALIEFQAAMTGQTEAIARHNQALQTAGQQTTLNRFAAGVREQGNQEVAGLQRNVGDATVRASVQRGLAQRLRADPDLVRFLNPEVERGTPDEFGANAQTGAARQGLLQARAARQEALGRQALREQEQAAAQERARRAAGATRPAEQESAAAQNRLRTAEQDLNSASAASEQELRDARVNAATKLRDLDAARAEKQAALNNLRESELRTQDAIKASAEADSEVRRAQLELQRNRLALLKEEEGVARSAARQAGASSEGQLQEVLAAVRQLKEQGVQTLTPQQKSLLQGNAATADFAGKKFEEAGAQSDTLKQINAEVGRRDLGTIKAERQQVEADITINAQLNKAKLAEDLRDALKEAFAGLRDVILQLVNEQIAARIDEGRAAKLQQQQQK